MAETYPLNAAFITPFVVLLFSYLRSVSTFCDTHACKLVLEEKSHLYVSFKIQL